MKTIKGPGLFLGQFAGDAAPFNSWDGITKWAAEKGYLGVQVPTWAGQLIDLKRLPNPRIIATSLRRCAPERRRSHRTFNPSARPVGGRASRL